MHFHHRASRSIHYLLFFFTDFTQPILQMSSPAIFITLV
ncbi:hypothetical protein CSB69_1338 [Morganella morganii]|nr:hypothetical protein CSB69_1338 [Morganella morganii]EMP49980.1 hypothetical protein C790_02652 [Morganella morganii SC01]